MPNAANSAFQATGLLSSKDAVEYDRQNDPGQTKQVGHWHEDLHAEEAFGLEAKREINLKWKHD
jgi:hypothetical protein